MIDQISTSKQLEKFQKKGYTSQVSKDTQGRTVKVQMTKELGFWGRIGLYLSGALRTIFTLHVNAKTRAEWNAADARKIKIAVDPKLWNESVFQTADKVKQTNKVRDKFGNSQATQTQVNEGDKSKPAKADKSELTEKEEKKTGEGENFKLRPMPQRHANPDEEKRLLKKGITVGDSFLPFPRIDDKVRYGVKDATLNGMKMVLNFDVTEKHVESENPPFIEVKHNLLKSMLAKVAYLKGPKDDQKPSNLLGRFDAVATPCVIEYDHFFKPRQNHLDQPPLYVIHAAAPNIGETSSAEDFAHYSSAGQLDEKKYLTDMGKIARNTLALQSKIGVKDTVWIPFGMGAFHEKLKDNDPTYNSKDKIFALKKACAQQILSQLNEFPDMTMHLCLPNDKRSQLNYNAFVAALSEMPESIRNRVQVYINGDATQVAQNLSNEKGEYQVGLVNGANRNLLGHFWYGSKARTAIDENTHRRSLPLALISYVLNRGYQEPGRHRNKAPDELEKTVENYKGKVYEGL